MSIRYFGRVTARPAPAPRSGPGTEHSRQVIALDRGARRPQARAGGPRDQAGRPAVTSDAIAQPARAGRPGQPGAPETAIIASRTCPTGKSDKSERTFSPDRLDADPRGSRGNSRPFRGDRVITPGDLPGRDLLPPCQPGQRGSRRRERARPAGQPGGTAGLGRARIHGPRPGRVYT